MHFDQEVTDWCFNNGLSGLEYSVLAYQGSHVQYKGFTWMWWPGHARRTYHIAPNIVCSHWLIRKT